MCVWVHSYVCIFKMTVFLHVTHSTFYTCGVICNAYSVNKYDYVTEKSIACCFYAWFSVANSCLHNKILSVHHKKHVINIWGHRLKDLLFCRTQECVFSLEYSVCARTQCAVLASLGPSPWYTPRHSSAEITAVDLSPIPTINARML